MIEQVNNETPQVQESFAKIMAKYRLDQESKQKVALTKLGVLAPEYIKNGYTNIHIYYSGCGDSGEVTEVYADTNSSDSKTHTFRYNDTEFQEMSEIVYDLLTYDWYNNDGGGGSKTIDLFHKEIEIDGYYIVEEQAPATDQESHLKF